MIVTIIGAGEIGRSLADHVIKRNHDVNVIDVDEDKCKMIAKEIEGAVVFKGDVLDESFLKHANLDSADVLAITPVNDDVAIKISAIAKKKFAVPYIVSMMDHDSNLEKFKAVGVDVTISQTKAVLQSFESALDKARSETLHISHEGDIKMVKLMIEVDSEIIGWEVSELKTPKELMLMLMTENGGPLQAPENQVIQANDVYYLFGKSEAVEKMRELMTRSGTS